MIKVNIFLRMPWKLKKVLQKTQNLYAFFINKAYSKIYPALSEKKILVSRKYYGESGGAIALSEIVNLISTLGYSIEVITSPLNDLNSHYNKGIKFTNKACGKYNLIICDDTTPSANINELRSFGKVLVSCHCLYDKCHGRKPEDMLATLESADLVQFVDECQVESFGFANKEFVVLPNPVSKIHIKTTSSGLGSVGDLDQERKNLVTTVEIFKKSKAEKLELWRCSNPFDEDKNIHSHHDWEKNKSRIFSSFSVLVFPSKFETFGLVVAEALSAGIPCVISNIPAFQHYKMCKAVQLIEPDDVNKGVRYANEFLTRNDELSDAAVEFWRLNYSPEVVRQKWQNTLTELMKKIR
jgi:glycosyltransferase involved in cell wall biosynthesis